MFHGKDGVDVEECFRNRFMESFGVFIILKFVSLETRNMNNMRRSRESLLGWKHWKIVIGYACILALITDRGLAFPAAKRLAFVLGEGKCLALHCGLLSVAAHCGKEVRVVR